MGDPKIDFSGGGRGMAERENWLPLKGIKVASFTQVIAGPACGMLLADLGADVIKVEPFTGDFWRRTVSGSAFMNFNRSKRSLAVNLKHPQGHEAVMRLLQRCDVLVENFTPGTMEKLNLGYDAVSRENPRIIYCSISGFGQDGPYRDRPGYDPVAQAMSGIMLNTGMPEGPPVRVLPTMVDYLAGNHMAYAIALALLEREKTGRGRRIEIALLDVAIMQMGQFVALYSMTGELPQRMGSGYIATAPYQAFETRDGYLYIAVTTDEMWMNLCRALKLERLAQDPKYANLEARRQNRMELAEEIARVTRQYPSKELEDLLVSFQVPCGRLMQIDEIMKDPHVLHRNIMAEVEYPKGRKGKIIKIPIFTEGKAPEVRGNPPAIGEHTVEILTEIGYSPQEIQKLIDDGAVIRNDKNKK
jgi:crotonobetainyl-CoA:carnitine CoA-transferase CaiB-like acyl-CoA transferase